jgi:hypothetical protein
LKTLIKKKAATKTVAKQNAPMKELQETGNRFVHLIKYSGTGIVNNTENPYYGCEKNYDEN